MAMRDTCATWLKHTALFVAWNFFSFYFVSALLYKPVGTNLYKGGQSHWKSFSQGKEKKIEVLTHWFFELQKTFVPTYKLMHNSSYI